MILNNTTPPAELNKMSPHPRLKAINDRLARSTDRLRNIKNALLAMGGAPDKADDENVWTTLETAVTQVEQALAQIGDQVGNAFDVDTHSTPLASAENDGVTQNLESLITHQRKALDALHKQIASTESTLHKATYVKPPPAHSHGDVELQDINDFLQESPIATIPINASYYQRILEAARSPEGHRRPMGSILLKAEVITTRQLENALRHQKEGQKRPLGSLLVDLGYTDDTAIAQAIAAQLALPFITLSKETVMQDALDTIPLHVARLHGCFPVSVNDVGALYVAMSNPLDLVALEDLRHASNRHVRPCVASRSEITDHINRHYAGSSF